MSVLSVVTPPAVEPVDATTAKLHLRVTHATEDTLIAGYITAARQWAEAETGRAFVTQTLEYSIDRWPGADRITLPMPPVQGVTSVIWRDEDGNSETLTAGTDYLADPVTGRIILPYATSWPSGALYPVRPIRIEYIAGYGLAVAVPAAIKQAILLRVGDLYEHREETLIGKALANTRAAEWLLAPYRVWESYSEANRR